MCLYYIYKYILPSFYWLTFFTNLPHCTIGKTHEEAVFKAASKRSQIQPSLQRWIEFPIFERCLQNSLFLWCSIYIDETGRSIITSTSENNRCQRTDLLNKSPVGEYHFQNTFILWSSYFVNRALQGSIEISV